MGNGLKFYPGKFFARVVSGDISRATPTHDQVITIKTDSVESGWLMRSAVAIMSRVVPLMTLQASFSMETDVVAQFRTMGGRAVLITFQSNEMRDSLIKHPWMSRWFDRVKPWQGEPASMERFIWLECK